MPSKRKTEISLQLFQTIQYLSEADMAMPQQPQTPQAVANSNPMQPLPGAGQQQVVGSSGGAPVSSTGEPLSVDTMIEKLNAIRGGKSFKDPEVYGMLTSYYKGLSDQDKSMIDSFLSEIAKVVMDKQQTQPGTAGQSQGTTNAQPPPGSEGGGQGAQARPGMSAGGGAGAVTSGVAGV